MIYSDLYTGQKTRIPTVIGVLLVLFIIGFFFSLTNRSAQPSRASQVNLKRIEITNLNPIQVTVFWQGDAKEVGWLAYSNKPGQLDNIALDDRDVSEKKSAYLNHYVTIKDLQPGQQYYYAIISNNKKIVAPDGSEFTFKTPLTSSANTKLDPANGKVLQANLAPLANAVVIVTVNDSIAPISTLTKDTGEWLVPLNSFYNKNSGQEQILTGKEPVKIEVLSEDGQLSTLTSTLNNIANNPQSIVIGKNYNYQEGQNVLGTSTGFAGASNQQKVEIVYPQEGALIPGTQPLIKGVALPMAAVSITIHSAKVYSANVTADKSGNWSYLIPDSLDLGPHTITIKTKDGKGNETIVTRNFTIVSNTGFEGKVLGTATDSSTVTDTPTPLPTLPSSYNNPTAPVISPTGLLKSGVADVLPIISGFSLIIVGGGILLVF
ncbi:Ig-like domain-containing protein [Patescibacteria group bacterium]|nr:Ig-like domain-containing protein [Patescibacteria group bacterium]